MLSVCKQNVIICNVVISRAAAWRRPLSARNCGSYDVNASRPRRKWRRRSASARATSICSKTISAVCRCAFLCRSPTPIRWTGATSSGTKAPIYYRIYAMWFAIRCSRATCRTCRNCGRPSTTRRDWSNTLSRSTEFTAPRSNGSCGRGPRAGRKACLRHPRKPWFTIFSATIRIISTGLNSRPRACGAKKPARPTTSMQC